MRHQKARATLLLGEKYNLPNGGVVQIRVWQLPAVSAERPHGLKYSLFFGRAGERIIGYDNEDGKGDHRHYRGNETAYTFISLEKLIEDFQTDVLREISHDRG